MKKILFSLGVMLSAFALTNCTQEIENPAQQPESAGYPFEIVASTVDTKTENDGMSTKWVAKDSINVFHSVSDSEAYVNDNFFVVDPNSPETGRFTGNLGESLSADKVYDWYAFYPYTKQKESPADSETGWAYIGHSAVLYQNGYDSMAALKGNVCPLYGVAKAVAGNNLPKLTMQHLSSVVAIEVTNTINTPLVVNSVSFSAPESIVGQYYITFDGDEPDYIEKDAKVKSTATVSVSNGAKLNNGDKAVVYAAIKPFTAKANQKLTLSVNGYSKDITLPKDVTFSAGKIKTLKFAYDKVEEPTPEGVVKATLTFDDKAKRTEYTTQKQVWEENGVTLTNNKSTSTTNVGDYFKPARFYKSSEVVVKAPAGIISIDFDCAGIDAKYVDPWAEVSGATLSGSIATFKLDGTSDEYSFTTPAQLRANSVTVTYSENGAGGETPEPEPEPDPDQPSELDEITVAEFLELKDTATEYTLTGKITSVANTTYGNFDLTDATGTVYVYGLLTPEGASQKQWAAAGLKQGDVITVKGKYNVYNNSPQVKNAVYVSHKSINVDKSALAFGAKGGSLDITASLVNATETISVSVDNSHFSVALKSGTTYTVTASANDTEEEIYANLTFSAGDLTAVVAISQEKPAAADEVAGGRDDFNTVAANNSYGSRKTTAGWTGANCAVMQGGTSDSNPTFKFIGTTNATRAFTMNGKTSAKGKITSPTLTTGCGKLSLKYGNAFSESNGVDFTVTIKQNGTAVQTYKVDVNSITQKKAYTWEQDVNVAGDFVIEITNNSPSNNSSSNKDRVSIWDIEWTGYAN